MGLTTDKDRLSARKIKMIEQLHSAAIRQGQVDQCEIELHALQTSNRLGDARGDRDVETLLARDLGSGVYEADIVVDDQQRVLAMAGIAASGVERFHRLMPRACSGTRR